MVATVLVVALRLAIPWPLKRTLELILDDAGSGYALTADWGSQLLWIVSSFVVMIALLGYAEYRQRVSMKQYAAATVHSLREATLQSITSRLSVLSDHGPDLISRIISDTARIKAELSGILLHASQNGLLYLGICIVFLVISPVLGLFFLAGGVMTVAIGIIARGAVTPISLKQRQKEGDYASVVQTAVDHGYVDSDSRAINRESQNREVRATRVIAQATWTIHVTLALITALALWYAMTEIQSGNLSRGELFLFMAYVLTVHRRMVQFGRQIARMGKMVANLTRLGELLEADTAKKREPITQFGDSIKLRDVRLRPAHRSIEGLALSQISLTIRPGEKVAVLGRSGSGKSALLRVIAGRARAKGRMKWDGQRVRSSQLRETSRLRFLPQVPAFQRQSLSAILGVSTLEDVDAELVGLLNLKRVLEGAVKGMDTKLSSSMLTTRESKGLMIYNLIADLDSQVWILDSVTEGLSKKRASRLMDLLFERSGDRLLVASLPYANDLQRFDRIVLMKRGRIAFNGSYEKWVARGGK